ncbi:MAG: hypothetical protein WBD20_10475 [Pirellulaceae bacterium]
MTVVPNRPQDGNRRPNVRLNGVQDNSVRSASDGAGSDSQEFPPVLFQLPNLNPSPKSQHTEVSEPGSQVPSEPAAADKLSPKLDFAAADRDDHFSSDLSGDVAVQSVQHDAQDAVVSKGRSVLSRLASYTMILTVLGLGATWVYVVAKNVRSTGETLTAQATDSHSDHDDQLKSSVSLEDTVANAERLAINPDGALPSYSQPVTKPRVELTSVSPESDSSIASRVAKPANESDQEMRAEVEAAALEVQAAMALDSSPKTSTSNGSVATLKPAIETPLAAPANDARPSSGVGSTAKDDLSPTDNFGLTTAKTVSAKLDNQFGVTKPAGIVTEQVSATAASNRVPTSSAQSAITPRAAITPLESNPSDADTPPLPESNVDSSQSQSIESAPIESAPIASTPVSSATPIALTPPLQIQSTSDANSGKSKDSATTAPKENVAAAEESPRRNSKTPTAVSNWLQYLPPAPQE